MKCFMTNQDCIHEPDLRRLSEDREVSQPGVSPPREEKKKVFIISPFEYPYDDIYEEALSKLDERGYDVHRADKSVQLGFVMCQKICWKIQEADFVLVDVTEDNPNVYYELGLAFGFGKQIVFLKGESRRRNASSVWQRFLEEQNTRVMTYEDLRPLYCKADMWPAPILDRYILDASAYVQGLTEPRSYIRSHKAEDCKDALFCVSSPLSDKRIWLDTTAGILESRKWQLHSLEIDQGIEITGLLNALRPCKACLIDVSHYNGRANPHAYWVLGVAHALGRDTIPVTNRARTSGHEPFDVRGLWQVYFDALKHYRSSLSDILDFVDREYDREIREYPRRYVWHRILRGRPALEVFTFGRGSDADPKRDSGRTNVDKWDYEAVAKFAFFLAQKYKQASVKISPPTDTRVGSVDCLDEVRRALSAAKSYIIVGSPDVSDYAEVVLAKAYDVTPYQPLTCNLPLCKGSECKNRCVGRSGYIFYKMRYFEDNGNADTSRHPRGTSFCYRDASARNKQFVLWYGKQFFCDDGITYGVISILRNPFARNCKTPSTVVVLSGFTGIATYGLAVLLAGAHKGEDGSSQLPEVDEAARGLQDLLEKHENEESVQILVKVKYDVRDKPAKDLDRREFRSVEIEDVRPLRPLEKSEEPGSAALVPAAGATGRHMD